MYTFPSLSLSLSPLVLVFLGLVAADFHGLVVVHPLENLVLGLAVGRQLLGLLVAVERVGDEAQVTLVVLLEAHRDHA